MMGALTKAWMVLLVFQFGEPHTHIVEFPSYTKCEKALDRTVDVLYGNDNVALVEGYCLYKE